MNRNSTYQQGIKFSVVIPAYNAAAFICNAIDSCLQQSYPPYEIILVDDGSRDNTEELILSKYKDRLVYIKLPFDMGVSVARNKGMNTATGDYIAFLDADDTWHIDKLQIVNSILEAKPDIDFLFHPFTSENILGKELPETGTLYKLPYIKLLLANSIGTPCVVLKNTTDYRFEPTMRHAEDYDLWLRVGYRHSLYFIELPLTQIGRPVLSKGGLSESKWKMRKGEMRAYLRLVKLNVLFILLMPFLLSSSLLKHFRKLILKP